MSAKDGITSAANKSTASVTSASPSPPSSPVSAVSPTFVLPPGERLTSRGERVRVVSWPRWVLGQLRAFFLFSFLVLSGAGFNVIQMMTWVVVHPFNPRLCRRWNDAYQSVWLWLFDVFLEIGGMELKFQGKELPPGRNAIVLSNHCSYLDPMIVFAFALRRGRLAGTKFFAKEAIKYMPATGWGMLFLDMVFVKRNWFVDAKRVYKVFQRLLMFGDQPFWLVTFPEGTRFERRKHEQAQKWCAENDRPVFQRILAPRTKGIVASVQQLRHRIDAVYDLTLKYTTRAPSAWSVLTGLAPVTIHIHCDEIPVNRIPTGDDEIAQWCWDLFVKKDKMLLDFEDPKSGGKFPGPYLNWPCRSVPAKAPTYPDILSVQPPSPSSSREKTE